MSDLPDLNELGYFSETFEDGNPICIPDSSPIRKDSTRLQEVGNTNVFSSQHLQNLSADHETVVRAMNENRLNSSDILATSEEDGSNAPQFTLNNLALQNNKGRVHSGDTDDFAELLLTPGNESTFVKNAKPGVQSDMLMRVSGFQSRKRKRPTIRNDFRAAEITNPPHSSANSAKTTIARSMEVIKEHRAEPDLRNEDRTQQLNRKRARKHNTVNSSSHITHPAVQSCQDAANSRHSSLSYLRPQINRTSRSLIKHVSKNKVTEGNEQAAKYHDSFCPSQRPAMFPSLVHSEIDKPVATVRQAPTSDYCDLDQKRKLRSIDHNPETKLLRTPQTQSRRTTSSSYYSNQPRSERELRHRARQGSWNEFKKAIGNLVTGYKQLLTCYGANSQSQRIHRATPLTPNHLADIGNAVTDLSQLVMTAAEDAIDQSRDGNKQDNIKPDLGPALDRYPNQQTKTGFELDKSQLINSAATHEIAAIRSPTGNSKLSRSLSDLKFSNTQDLPFPSCFGVSDHLNTDQITDETGPNSIPNRSVKTSHNAVSPACRTIIAPGNHDDAMPVSSINYDENLMKTQHIDIQQVNPLPKTAAYDELRSNLESAVASIIPNPANLISTEQAFDESAGEEQNENAQMPSSNQTTSELAGPSWLNGEVFKYVMQNTDDCMEGKNVTDAISPQALIQKTPQEVREILKVDDRNRDALVSAVQDYWESNEDFHQIADRLETRLKEKGIKLERRKRMGPEIPPEQKKAIRAQRNRERSQALRKHHKIRVMELESGSITISDYNKCIRSLIYCLLDKEESLPLVQDYFKDPERFDDSFLNFLHTGE